MTVLTPANAFPNLAFPQHNLSVTWNPLCTDVLITAITLSGGALVATWNSASRSVICNVSGTKFYFETVITNDPAPGSAAVGIGVGDSTFTSGILGESGTNSITYFDSDQVYYNNGSVANPKGSSPSFTTGDNVGVAVDIANHLIWWRVNGGNWNFNAGADPATATGGISTGAIASPVFAAAVGLGTAGEIITAKFASSSFTYTAPAGFSALVKPTLGPTRSFTYPGAVWPKATGPVVLSWTNAFPNLAFPQHLSGQTKTVQNFLYPGAVQPQLIIPPTLFAQILM